MAAILPKHAAAVRTRDDERDTPGDRVLVVLQVSVFVCGVAAPAAGLLLAVIHGIFPSIPAIELVATVLCMLGIPLLLLGSHVMDVIDRRRVRRRETPSVQKLQKYDNN